MAQPGAELQGPCSRSWFGVRTCQQEWLVQAFLDSPLTVGRFVYASLQMRYGAKRGSVWEIRFDKPENHIYYSLLSGGNTLSNKLYPLFKKNLRLLDSYDE
jgi:hypothetical protein